MTAWPTEPVIYELNTVAWLDDVSRRAGKKLTLGKVPSAEWDRVTPAGVDAVWLMGVWQRSRLPDVVDDDVIGSAYSIRNYKVAGRCGGRKGLAAARAALAERGVRLIVDFVPNHVGPDHRWLKKHPEYFIGGSTNDLAQDPDGFLEVGKAVVARGRDPFFPPWPDVVQLNAFAPALRRAAAETLIDISTQADGVRCDMAMLMLNDVFAGTWGDRAGAIPEEEYWTAVIGAVRAIDPDFLFVAEAYWDLESRLHDLGFDYCYDKRLYDRLVHEDASSVRAHLCADVTYQRRLVRFLENHDEPRIAGEMSPERERAAAVAVATLPGATLWHDGQFEGWREHVSVFLRRRPTEDVDEELRAFHLLLIAAASALRHGVWQLCEATGWPDDHRYDQLLAWSWTDEARRSLVVINDADAPAAARLQLPWGDLAGSTWSFDDVLAGARYERDGSELAVEGLYVELPAWGYHVFAVTVS